MIEMINSSIKNMGKRKMRSSLTIISVLIGIAAIFILISFGQGLIGFIGEISQKMGDDKLIVRPKGTGLDMIDSNIIFSKNDEEVVDGVLGVEEATGVYFTSTPIEYNNKRKYVFAIGSNIKEHRKLITEIYTLKIESGRQLKGREKSDAILGQGYKKENNPFKKTTDLYRTLKRKRRERIQ